MTGLFGQVCSETIVATDRSDKQRSSKSNHSLRNVSITQTNLVTMEITNCVQLHYSIIKQLTNPQKDYMTLHCFISSVFTLRLADDTNKVSISINNIIEKNVC